MKVDQNRKLRRTPFATPMDQPSHQTDPVSGPLSLAGYMVDVTAGTLRDASGQLVPMRPQAWAVLRVLALSAGRVVTKDELLALVWPGLVVTDSSLAQAVSDVRTALGQAGLQVIRTVPRRGYMLLSDAILPRSDLLHLREPVASLRVETNIYTDDRPSLAVLTIGSSSADPNRRKVSADLSNEIAAGLARNADLRIASRRSSAVFDDSTLSSAEIGAHLRSRYLVETAIRRDARALRLLITLIDSADGRQVWSTGHLIDRLRGEPMEVSWLRKVAGGLHSAARYADVARALSSENCDDSAYGLTMRSLAVYRDCRRETISNSRALLSRALQQDQHYAPAWAWLGLLLVNEASLFGHPLKKHELASDAQAHARRALTLDNERPVAWRALAFARLLQRDFAAALASMHRSAALSPSNADSMQALGIVQFWCGETSAALASIESALDLHEHASSWIAFSHGAALWGVGRAHEALVAMERGRAEQAHHWGVRAIRIAALVETDRMDEARQEAATLLAETPGVTIEQLLDRFPDDAIELRERMAHAASVVKIPKLRL